MRIFSRIAVFALAALLGSVSIAAAASVSGSLSVTATVATYCTSFSPGTLSFGTGLIFGTAYPGSATFNIQCTNGDSVGITASDTYGLANAGTCAFTSGSTVQPYTLNIGGTPLPCNNTGSNSVTATGSPTQPVTISGSLTPLATTPAGLYSDTVTVTLTY